MVRWGYVNTMIKYLLRIRANLKRSNRVYILSSKHIYRPMRAPVISKVFYTTKYKTGVIQDQRFLFSTLVLGKEGIIFQVKLFLTRTLDRNTFSLLFKFCRAGCSVIPLAFYDLSHSKLSSSVTHFRAWRPRRPSCYYTI